MTSSSVLHDRRYVADDRRVAARTTVSVVIPTYNCAAWLSSCLESVFAQTWRDFEVIVVDDGSTDDTRAVLQPWTPIIRHISQAHAGVAAARNAAIRASSAPLVAFLDADDLWAERKLELEIAALAADPDAGLVCSDFSILNADGTRIESYFRQRGGHDSGRVFARLLSNCFVFTSTVVLRRSLIDTLGAFDESISDCDDYNMWLRAALKTRVAVVDEVLCTKQERPGNARPFEQTSTSWIGALRNLFTQMPQMDRRERRLVRAELGRLELAHARFLVDRRRMREAIPHLQAAAVAGNALRAAKLLLGIAVRPLGRDDSQEPTREV